MIWYLLGGLIGIVFLKKRYNLTFWQAVWNGIIFVFGLYFGWGTILGIIGLILGLEDYTEISILGTIFYAALTLGSFLLIRQLKNKKTTATTSERKKPKRPYEDNYNFKPSEIIKTSVVGVTFEGRQRLIQTLTSGQPIKLIREPENKHDSNAIKIIVDDNKNIGYINKNLAKRIAPIIDNELTDEIMGEIVSIYPVQDRPSVLGVKICFQLKELKNESKNSINRETIKNENVSIPTSSQSYVRCPKCGRNDRVEKVIAMYEYKTASPVLLSKLEPPNPTIIKLPKFNEIPEINLPKKPSLIILPNTPEVSIYILLSYVFGSFLSLTWVFVIIYIMGNNSPLTTLKLILTLLSAMVLLLIFLGIKQTKRLNQKFKEDINKIQKKNDELISGWKQKIEKEKQEHKEIIKRIEKENEFLENNYLIRKRDVINQIAVWEKLYYCFRDDTIFIPDTGEFAQVEKLIEFLKDAIKDPPKIIHYPK